MTTSPKLRRGGQIEKRFIAEYVMRFLVPNQWVLNQPLGEVVDDLVRLRGLAVAAAIVRPTRRRVDAVAWTNDVYYIIEAKIRDPVEGLGRLCVYREEAAVTPDLPGFTGQPIIPRLVIPFSIERDRTVAAKLDIEIVEFAPPWVADYVRSRQEYFTSDARRERQRVREVREALGVE